MECAMHPGVVTERICQGCGQALCKECQVQVSGKAICRSCEASLRQEVANELRMETQQPNYILATLLGLFVALLGGALWAVVGLYGHYKLGIIAWGIGIGVGNSVIIGSGGKKGSVLQWLGGILGAIGIIAGEFLFFYGMVLKDGRSVNVPHFWLLIMAAKFFPMYLRHLRPLDWIFIVFGIYYGYRVPRHFPNAGNV